MIHVFDIPIVHEINILKKTFYSYYYHMKFTAFMQEDDIS